ncbi:MAG: outer membrane beta-barrel protein [Bacteroidia bacterium]
MKKLVLIFAFISGAFVSFSQSNLNKIPSDPIEESKFSFGIKGGFGHSFIVPYKNTEFMPSWDAGLSAVYSPFVHWGFGLDAIYSAEGAKFTSVENSYVTNLNYVRIPVKVIYFFNEYKNDFRPKVAIGPTVGFLTNAKDNPGFTKTDFGANASLGFNYRLLRAVWLSVDGTYYQGLIDSYTLNNENDLNGNVRLDVGINIGF